MIEKGFSDRTVGTHEWILRHFKTFAADLGLPGEKAVLPENRAAFLDRCKLTKARGVIVEFSQWLEETGVVEKNRTQPPRLCPTFLNDMWKDSAKPGLSGIRASFKSGKSWAISMPG